MPNDEQEVKEFNEVKVMEPTPNKEDDEIIEPIVKENETPAPSSEEDKLEPEVETESETLKEVPEESNAEPEAEVTPEIKEPKPVEGETPREKALRLEVTRLKAINREQKRDDLFVKKPVISSKEKEEELSEYDEDEVKRFEVLASKLGFAKKDEFIQQSVLEKNNTEFDSFLEAHPEYVAENDKDGLLWNQFKSEFSLYNPTQDPKTLRKVLNKVHESIFGVKPAMNLNKINAQQQKLKVASHSGSQGSKAPVASVKAPNSNIRKDMLKGFSEEELAELDS